MLFNETITIYNCRKTTSGLVWKRSVLDRAMVVRDVEKVFNSDGVLRHVPVVTVTIPYRGGYVDSKEFNGTGWTVGLDNKDLVVLGYCDTEITEANFASFKKSHPDTWTVKGLEDNSGRTFLPHWRITCEA